jgi:predicted ATPase/DNA-binding XRE family transcriptional regulator
VAAGLSQEELAERAGLSRRGISDLERGARRSPHPATLRRLVEALNLDQAQRAALLSTMRPADMPVPAEMPSEPTPTTVVGVRPESEDVRSFAELLRAYRANACLTQEALATMAGLSVRAISDLERGVRRLPYPDTLGRLVQALGVGGEERAKLESAAARFTTHGEERVGVDHNLPVQLTSFVGRVQEIADIRRELARTRLLTLAGPGGVGKTRLALRVAEEELTSYPDGVWFVELAPLTEPSLVPQTVADLFNIRETPDEPLITTLARVLQPGHRLLVLDNCEHVLAASVDLVHRLLRACPRLVVLATSREVLGLTSEKIWRVPSLQLIQPNEALVPEEVAQCEAAALFVERARAIQSAFAVTPRNAAALLEVCRRVGGIPLAIELAASRVRVLGLEQIADRLATDTAFLASRDRTTAGRQQTLEKTIWWSYDLLTPAEQFLFNRLSVFAGGWTLEAMEGVAAGNGVTGGELLDVLERLIDKSLVQADDALDRPPRYRMLEPLRQFGRSRLEERSELTATHERHAAFFLGQFERTEQEFFRAGVASASIRKLDSEADNLRVALRWLLGQSDVVHAQRLAGAARILWFNRGYLAEGRRWLEEALALNPGAGGRLESDIQLLAARTKVLFGITLMAVTQGDLAAAEDTGLLSLQLSRQMGNRQGAAFALTFLATAASAAGDLARARRLREEALVLATECGIAGLHASLLIRIADLDIEEGEFAAAQQHGETGLKLAKACGYAEAACRGLTVLGELQYRLGRPETAQRLWEEALTLVRGSNPRHVDVISTFLDLGQLALDPGIADRARAWLAQGLTLAREISRFQLTRGLEVMVEVTAADERDEQTLHFAAAAAALRDAMGTPLWPSERSRLDPIIARARQNLGAAAADAAWMRGWTIPVDETVALALDVLRQPSVA